MIIIKTPDEIVRIQESGKIARQAMTEAVSSVKPGVTTTEINNIAERVIKKAGGMPVFKGHEGFPCATCINVNSGIVHGLPGSYRVRTGDIVSIDLGVLYKGMISDVSESLEVGTETETDFLKVGRRALEKAIATCIIGKHIGDISSAIQTVIEGAGYSVSRDLAGHGVGRELHEDPFIECFGKSGTGPELKEGMTLAVEVIYQKGSPELVLDKDGWTLSTKDGSLAGLFEKSIAVTRQGALVLT